MMRSTIVKKNGEYRVRLWTGQTLLEDYFTTDLKDAQDTLKAIQKFHNRCIFCDGALVNSQCPNCGSRRLSPLEELLGCIKPPDFGLVMEDYLTEWFVYFDEVKDWKAMPACEAVRHNDNGRPVRLGKA